MPLKFFGRAKYSDEMQIVYGLGCYSDPHGRHFIIIDKPIERQYVEVEKINVIKF